MIFKTLDLNNMKPKTVVVCLTIVLLTIIVVLSTYNGTIRVGSKEYRALDVDHEYFRVYIIHSSYEVLSSDEVICGSPKTNNIGGDRTVRVYHDYNERAFYGKRNCPTGSKTKQVCTKGSHIVTFEISRLFSLKQRVLSKFYMCGKQEDVR